MRSTANIIAIILIIFGAVCLVYGGFSYTQRDKVADVGSVHITADTQKNVYVSPIVGGISLVAGVVLLMMRRK